MHRFARLASGPIWRRADFEAWAKRTLPLPTGRPRKVESRETSAARRVLSKLLVLRRPKGLRSRTTGVTGAVPGGAAGSSAP
jgi:hypothetical protein